MSRLAALAVIALVFGTFKVVQIFSCLPFMGWRAALAWPWTPKS